MFLPLCKPSNLNLTLTHEYSMQQTGRLIPYVYALRRGCNMVTCTRMSGQLCILAQCVSLRFTDTFPFTMPPVATVGSFLLLLCKTNHSLLPSPLVDNSRFY